VNIPSWITSSPLAHELFGNPLYVWGIALAIVLGVVLVVSIVVRVLSGLLRRLAGRTRQHIDEVLVEALGATRLWLIALAALHPAVQVLDLAAAAHRVVYDVAIVAFFLQVGLWAARLFKTWLTGTRTRTLESNPAAASSFGAIAFLGSIALWSVIALLAFDNLGINVSALVAGLGIGGIAIGLALQNILGDLFASLSIVLDKPFVVGDFLTIDTFAGTVESIGVKTTRLRTMDGELLVFANGDLTKSRLRNAKRRVERPMQFGFGVRLDTPPELLERIPPIVREIVEAQPDARFDRAHLKAIGATSLDFEVVWAVRVLELKPSLDAQQEINLALLRRFAELGIEFAVPGRTLYFAEPLPLARAAPNPIRDAGISDSIENHSP
jgi:small-conductance mechanosensitive channel